MADNGIRSLDIFIKMQDFPPLSITEHNIGRSWCIWKQAFLSFLQKEDDKKIYKNQWTNILFMLIAGPLEVETYRNLCHETNLEIVLRQLDIHFIFGLKKKQKRESVDLYIDSLMFTALASNHNDPVSIVKEKVVQDIKNYNFTEKAMLFIQSKGENLVSYLQSLDLHKITLFWKQCEESMSQKNHEAIQRQSVSNPQIIESECARCGTRHTRNCPAYGSQCDNCKGYNHFTDKCRVKYVSDCTKCGTNHVQSRCLAFGELCANCGKINHFSWLCQVPVVKDCQRCGKDHAISMCPAQGSVCFRCKKPNHFKEKCLSK